VAGETGGRAAAGHAIAPDHVTQDGEADGPEDDEAQNHGDDPGGFALPVEPV
jgi:hypothetical protein